MEVELLVSSGQKKTGETSTIFGYHITYDDLDSATGFPPYVEELPSYIRNDTQGYMDILDMSYGNIPIVNEIYTDLYTFLRVSLTKDYYDSMYIDSCWITQDRAAGHSGIRQYLFNSNLFILNPKNKFGMFKLRYPDNPEFQYLEADYIIIQNAIMNTTNNIIQIASEEDDYINGYILRFTNSEDSTYYLDILVDNNFIPIYFDMRNSKRTDNGGIFVPLQYIDFGLSCYINNYTPYEITPD